MRSIVSLLSFLTTFLTLSIGTQAQDRRPIPYPVIPFPGFLQAVENGTRSLDGNPGPEYWQNAADYTIRASLSPDAATLRGDEVVRYWNNSPDTLRQIKVHLYQNIHREGTARNIPVMVTGGMNISEVTYRDEVLLEHASQEYPGFHMEGTVMHINLPNPIMPNNWAEFGFSWSFEVPEHAPRMGREDDVFFLGYWYPQIAVYDDVRGWKADPYMGIGEFYMPFGKYDVAVTVPAGWLVSGTGELQNAEELLPGEIVARLRQASYSNGVVPIVTATERQAGLVTNGAPGTPLTWRFHAENVRDFAFSASHSHVWDATTAAVGDRNADGQPDTALIHAFYRPEIEGWNRAAEYGQFSIEYLSENLIPYPYPQMTIVEGIIGGGMEYPMITLIGTTGERATFGTTFHEISHMWFPMVVGSDEKEYAWMDEGLVTFNTNDGTAAFYNEDIWGNGGGSTYFLLGGTGLEVEPMRHIDAIPPGNFTTARVAAYSKPALTMHALRGMVGLDQFREAYRTYAQRWAFKHPYPYDLFNTFENVLGQDLDWFWTSYLFETWTLDHAIENVDVGEEGIEVTIADRGYVPMPTVIRVTYDNETTAEEMVPVDVWLSGDRQTTLRFQPGRVTRVQIDPDWLNPDIDRTNNVWVWEE